MSSSMLSPNRAHDYDVQKTGQTSTSATALVPPTMDGHNVHSKEGQAAVHGRSRPISVRIEAGLAQFAHKVEHGLYMDEAGRSKRMSMWDRFRGKNRRRVTWKESAQNTIMSSIMNFFLIFTPLAWASHWAQWNNNITFTFAFLSLVPLEKLFDFGGEQMALYVGRDLGDLIIITLNNILEATLAITLLIKCELRLLQATITGVVLLHLLLVPGVGFLYGGARLKHQRLSDHEVQLNATLLAIGVLSLLVPASFFAASFTGLNEDDLTSEGSVRNFLTMSHGMAILLLTVYIASRVFLHNPPGENEPSHDPASASPIITIEKRLREEDPLVNSTFCVVFLIITIAIMAFTAEVLVESIDHVREEGKIGEEWFGLILLPLLSFSGDAAVSILHFFKTIFKVKSTTPKTLAEDRAIDLSIQFTLFWMPVLVLLGWWTGRPFMMLFDMFEVAVLIGSCFLVNYVTADAKTNWAEGYIMIVFYVIIALCAWFYNGQNAIDAMLSTAVCREDELQGDPLGEAAATLEKVVGEIAQEVRKRAIRF